MTAVYSIATSMHDGAGNFFQNVFHYQLSEAGTLTPYDYATELIAAWSTANETDYLKLMGTDVVLDFYTAKKVTGGGGPSATLIRAFPGIGASSSISSAFAADVAWISQAASNRPAHTFLSGIPDGGILNGQWQNPYQGDVGTWIADMLIQLVIGGGGGTADFIQFVRKTQAANLIKHGILRPKPTGINRRTLPII